MSDKKELGELADKIIKNALDKSGFEFFDKCWYTYVDDFYRINFGGYRKNEKFNGADLYSEIKDRMGRPPSVETFADGIMVEEVHWYYVTEGALSEIRSFDEFQDLVEKVISNALSSSGFEFFVDLEYVYTGGAYQYKFHGCKKVENGEDEQMSLFNPQAESLANIGSTLRDSIPALAQDDSYINEQLREVDRSFDSDHMFTDGIVDD